MGIGLSAAYGVAAANDELQQLLARRVAERQYADRLKQQDFENRLRERQIESAEEIKRQALEDRRQRDRELADVRMENATTRQIGTMRRGAHVSPEQYERFNRYGYGAPAYFEHEAAAPATLPSTQSVGVSQGFLRAGPMLSAASPSQPATPERYRFTGTNAQDIADERFQTQREIADARAEAARSRQQALDTYRNSALDLRERNLQRLQDQFDNRINPPDNPELPRGVSAYLLQLRSRHGTNLQGAENELARTWGDLTRDHPRLDATKTAAALRSMFNAPAGVPGYLQLGGGDFLSTGGISSPNAPRIVGGGRGAGPGVGPASAGGFLRTPGGAGGNTITRSELQAVARQLGISEAEAEQQATSRGMTVR